MADTTVVREIVRDGSLLRITYESGNEQNISCVRCGLSEINKVQNGFFIQPPGIKQVYVRTTDGVTIPSYTDVQDLYDKVKAMLKAGEEGDAITSIDNNITQLASTSTLFRDNSVSNTIQVMKSTAGRLCDLEITNNSSTDAIWFNLYTSASPTVGSPSWDIRVPAGGSYTKTFVTTPSFPNGIRYAAVNAPGGTDAPALTPNLSATYV